MANNPDDFEKQIAALKSALLLPLPDESRRQLTESLLFLQAQRATRADATFQGTANVNSVLHGNAIGVNLGPIQTYFGTQLPTNSGEQPSTTSQEQIDDQRELLDAHRRTLTIYLKQQATLGIAFVPPGVTNGIREARNAIQRIKTILRRWDISVADHPDDEASAP